MYSGVKISEVVESNKGIGGVMALLWFQVINMHVKLMVLVSNYAPQVIITWGLF